MKRLALGLGNACILFVAGATCTLSCGNESTGGPSEGAGTSSSAAAGHPSGSLASAGTLASGHPAAAGAPSGPGTTHVGHASQLGANAGSDAPMQVTANETLTEPAFSITLSTSGCLEGCPEYDVKVDQSGNIEFNGRGHTRQQGWAGKTTSPQTASELLTAIRTASYWQLNDVYRAQSDGCTEVMNDRATYIWNVKADGVAKIVVDYQGCAGVPQLDALRRVPVMLTNELQLHAWIGS